MFDRVLNTPQLKNILLIPDFQRQKFLKFTAHQFGSSFLLYFDFLNLRESIVVNVDIVIARKTVLLVYMP